MPGDTSYFDVCIKIWGSDLIKLSPEYRPELLQDLQDAVETGGCFEDEGFLSTTCNGEVLTIKPLTWFRSKKEAEQLIQLCHKLN